MKKKRLTNMMIILVPRRLIGLLRFNTKHVYADCNSFDQFGAIKACVYFK